MACTVLSKRSPMRGILATKCSSFSAARIAAE